uniref:Methyltransf_11 domain-containing protein n=1 Tax=Ganoderma boninense TaxID=34458 RepID=A0A5K1JYT1_9APHY|nr:Methyltransf_11 domain-containing protein [Ganoderma boninense]
MLLSLLASLIPPITAVSVNVTVDDTHGSSDGTVIPVYSPNNASWHLGSPTEQCSVCAIKPSEFDTNQIYDQTWHHATYFVGIPIQVSVTFRGTAVYVYNVIPNFLKGANTNVNLAFTIDGVTVGQFTHTPDSSGTILYNHLVYSTTGLADAEHTLVMSASGSKESLIIFDYLVYTTEVDATTSSAASTSASANPPANTLAPAPSSTTPGTRAPTSTSSPSPSSKSNSNSVSASGSGSSSTALPASAAASTSSSSAALDTASSSHSHTAAIAGGVRSSMSAAIDPYTMNSNFDAKAVPETDASESESTMPPLVHIGGLASRPVSASVYSNHATDGGAFPTLASPVTSPRTLDAKREFIRGHPHLHSPPRTPGGTPLDSDFSLSGSRTGPGGDLSSAGESRVSAGAVQALQEELAALRGVLSGMTARGGGGAPGHNQPALCESEVLPGYEEARWCECLRF